MEEINLLLLAVGTLLFAALLLSGASQRFGVPALLVFLAVGLFATELPGVPAQPIDTRTAALIGNLALAVILLDGGLRTRVAALKMVAAPALTLATLGVVLTAALLGALAVALLGFDWRYGLLLGAITGSTDAAAVFALLRTGGVPLNERVAATLEVESGLNDPAAVFLTVALIEVLEAPDGDALGPLAALSTVGSVFLVQLGVGAACGLALGWLLGEVVARLKLPEALYALLIQSGGLMLFAVTNLLGGSGFLAIYLAGVLVARRRVHVGEDVLRASDGVAWLAQATMFLILGLFAQWQDLWAAAAEALLVAAGLIVFARPLAVLLCLLPFRYPLREVAFTGWTGLRGAVPIVLALLPLLAGLPDAGRLFSIAFFCVLLSLVVQGMSLRPAAHRFRVTAAPVSEVVGSAVLAGARGHRELVEIRLAPGSQVIGRLLVDVPWPPGVHPVAPPGPAAPLAADDLVAVVAPPDRVQEIADLLGPRAADGEFPLDDGVTLGDLRDAYGIALPAGSSPAQPVASFVGRRLRGRAVVGDRVALGALWLTVRRASGGRVRGVGLRP